MHISYKGETSCGGKGSEAGVTYLWGSTGSTSLYTETAKVGKMIKIRVVLDALNGASTWRSNDNGTTWKQIEGMTATEIAKFAASAPLIGKEARMKSGGGLDATIDNVKIYKIKREAHALDTALALDFANPVYFNDFNSVDSTLSGDELTSALGWYYANLADGNIDGYADTQLSYNGAFTKGGGLSVTNKYGSNAITIATMDTFESLVFVGNDRLKGGNYAIQFDAAFESTNQAGETLANDPYRGATVGSGASAGPASGGAYASSPATPTNETTRWHYGIKSRGQRDIHIAYPSTNNAGVGISNIDYTPADYDATTMYSKTAAKTRMLTFRIVVTATQGVSAWISYNGGDSWWKYDGMTDDQITQWAANAKNIGAEVRWRATGGMDVTIDNLGIYVFTDNTATHTAGKSGHVVTTTTPELVISAISTQATAADNQMHHTLAKPEVADTENGEGSALAGKNMAAVDKYGNYILPADESQSLGTLVTRYEYLEIYNSGDKTIDLSDYSISSWAASSSGNGFSSNGLSALSRIHKGLKVVTDKTDGLQWQFYNAPEDCILRPGEAAILFMPNNWFWSDPTSGHVNAFKQYVLINEYGMTPEQVENTKVLTLYDSLDDLYTMYGKDCYTVANGMGISNGANSILAVVKDNADGTLPYTYNTDKKCLISSVGDNLISYVADSNSADNTMWKWYSGKEYSNEAARAGYKFTGGYAAQFTYWNSKGEFIPGGKLDTTRLPSAKNVENRTVGYVPADLANPNVDATKGGVNEAQWVGSQNTVAENGLAQFRLVASIADVTDVKNIAFVISVGDKVKTVYLKYFYESVTTDFGEGIYKPETGYVVALEIPETPVDTVFTVKVVTIDANGLEMVSAAKTVTYKN